MKCSFSLALLLTVGPLSLALGQQPKPSPKVEEVVLAPAQKVLAGAETLEVLLLDCDRPALPGEAALRGYPILGTQQVRGDDRAKLIATLYQGVDEGVEVALSWEPRYAVRAKVGDAQVEVLLAFSCSQLKVYDGAQHPAGSALDPGAMSDHTWGSTSDAVRPQMDRLLAKAKAQPGPFGGKPANAWLAELEALSQRKPKALGAEANAAAGAFAQLLLAETGWHSDSAERARKVLHELGPLATSVVASARRALQGDACVAWEVAAGLLQHAGPAAAESVAELGAMLTRDFAPLIAARAAQEEADEDDEPLAGLSSDEVEDLQLEVLRALQAIGEPARAAIPALKQVAEGENHMLAQEAKLILKGLGK